MSAVLKVTEREFQSSVIDFARACGWRVFHVHDSRRQVAPGRFVGDRDAAGFPDLVLVREGRLLFAELKSPEGRLSQSQRQWLQALDMTGAEVAIWRPDEWPAIETTLRRERIAKLAVSS
jgi:hypothetical protein